jgi:hypothetical protein
LRTRAAQNRFHAADPFNAAHRQLYAEKLERDALHMQVKPALMREGRQGLSNRAGTAARSCTHCSSHSFEPEGILRRKAVVLFTSEWEKLAARRKNPEHRLLDYA